VQDTGAALYPDRDAQASRCSRLSSRRLNFLQAALEKSALAAIGDQGQCPFIALRRFCCGSDSAQQIGTGGMEQVVVVEITACNERVNELERGRGAIHHRDRDRPVQRHNRRRLYPLEHIVKAHDPATNFWSHILNNEALRYSDNLEKLVVGCEIIAALDAVDLLAA